MSDLDLKSTVNLPRTDFPMKANLAVAEPRRLEAWAEKGIYRQLRAARAGKRKFVLHDGPPYANGEIHMGTVLNKVLKDLVVRSRSMAGFDAPYIPGWDCHGLPIELQVDKALGGKKRQMEPVAIRKACRAHAEKYVGIQRKGFQRLGIMGEWDEPYLTMNPGYQAAIVGQLADCVQAGLVYKAKKSVHWCISCRTALAEAEVEYDENHVSPSIDVRFPLADGERERLAAAGVTVPPGRVSAVIWTTTPWTLPANLAVAFHPDADYAFFPVEGSDEVLLLAQALGTKAAERWNRLDGKLGEPLGLVKGAQLEHVRFRHPWIDRDSPGVLGDYVTMDTGTGVVHTAPGHGWDDYLTGVRYGLEIYCPVDEAGFLAPEIEHFAGMRVLDLSASKAGEEGSPRRANTANPEIVAFLEARGSLLSSGKEKHSYPVCWRCKNPIIFRATEQWFIGMDREDLRGRALTAIKGVRWFPAWGEERIHNMIEGRPDWCISRQRLWGVPIPAFYCQGCNEAILTPEVARHVAGQFAAESADVWFERTAEQLLPPGFACPKCAGTSFSKEKDILDVWFDSGSSHAAVLEPRGLGWPADVYLEGSDQHRGWFHSSLLLGVATHGGAPYRQVITHGFIVDEKGRKQSKSLGNYVDAEKSMATHGAEVLRLWVSMVDYREDISLSDEMLKRNAEAYRKLRNTCRYLLSNLFDFDAATHAVPEEKLEAIDRYALQRHRQLVRRVRAGYDAYEFHVVYHQILQYCAVDLSSFYLDVLKDRLYCDPVDGPRRRSAQTVMARIAEDLTRLLAPVLPFTTDEVWSYLPGARSASVHLETFPEPEPEDAAVIERWSRLLDVRTVVMKALEEERAAKRIAASLEAQVTITAPEATLAELRAHEAEGGVPPGNLANLFIVSAVTLQAAEGPIKVEVTRAPGRKCERCWTWSEAVGTQAVHPGVCARCALALETRA